MSWARRAQRLLPGLWAGALLCIALVATPAPFATLTPQDAGRVVGRIFAQEAYLSLFVAIVVIMLERRTASSDDARMRLTTPILLALGAVFCTVAGYFGLQPMMAAARMGEGPWTFGQLHAASLVLFGIKILAVSWLAWMTAGPDRAAAVSPAGPSS